MAASNARTVAVDVDGISWKCDWTLLMQERTSRLPFFPDWLGQMETCWIILWCNMLGFFLRQAAGWAVAKASMANPSQRYLPNGARAQHRGTFLGSRLRRQPMDLLTCSDGPRQGADVWAK